MPDYEAILRPIAGDHLRLMEPLSRYTLAQLGGPADALVLADSVNLLEQTVRVAWENELTVRVIGGGANILIGDGGFRGLVVVNRARGMAFGLNGTVEVESGVIIPTLARECMVRGLGGFEWAVGVPGTIGGAVVNNAGAHGSDMAACVEWVEVAEANLPKQKWSRDRLEYQYRESALKRRKQPYAVLRAGLRFTPNCDPAVLAAQAETFHTNRRRTQPPGASLGSMFKNPTGDYAGRLIEAAGLKGVQHGRVMISPIHANFFVNMGGGTAADYLSLIRLAQTEVLARFNVALELEIELVGEM